MNKDFDLNLKMDKGPSDDVQPRVTSMMYCTPGCLTGTTCGSSECGATGACSGITCW